ASLWPKFASPRFRMSEDFTFRLDCFRHTCLQQCLSKNANIFGSVHSGRTQQLEKFACAARIDEQFVRPTHEARRTAGADATSPQREKGRSERSLCCA